MKFNFTKFFYFLPINSEVCPMIFPEAGWGNGGPDNGLCPPGIGSNILFKLFEFPAELEEFGALVADLGKVLGVLGLKIILELGLRLTSPLFISDCGCRIIFLNLGGKFPDPWSLLADCWCCWNLGGAPWSEGWLLQNFCWVMGFRSPDCCDWAGEFCWKHKQTVDVNKIYATKITHIWYISWITHFLTYLHDLRD